MDNKELYHYGVMGQKWGVRRYQNKDGSLTPAGQKRYDRDIRENNAKKKENRIIIDGPDANRWAKEDLSRAKKTVDTSSSLVKELKTIERESRPTPVKKKMDLSNMTDQELRDRINRANLEKQYNDLFGEPAKVTVSKGRKFAQNVLEVGGSVLAVTGSALGVALAIRDLMNKSGG